MKYMAKKRSKWYWLKENQIFTILGSAIGIVVIFISLCSYRFEKSQRKSPALDLNYSRSSPIWNASEIETGVSLELINRGDADAHRVELNVIIPKIGKSTWEINKYENCMAQKKNDSLMVVNLMNRVIRPTLRDDRKYTIYFVFKDITATELKKSEKYLKFTINCKENKVGGTILLSDIFSEYFP